MGCLLRAIFVNIRLDDDVQARLTLETKRTAGFSRCGFDVRPRYQQNQPLMIPPA